MSQIGNDFKFYVAAPLEVVNETNARAITSDVCKVKNVSLSATRAEITSASRCNVSRRSGTLTVGLDVTFEFDSADSYYYLLRTAFYTNNAKVFVAEVYPDLATGYGTAGNASVTSFAENHNVDAYAEVTVKFVFEVADLLILND